jgi:malonate-semialdehyde dehydrogenase (acetylating)/methylmalonate-semialdehyde dehydrogenase
MPDADMDKAADALMGAGYGSAGERCMAYPSPCLSVETADSLVQELARASPP